MADCVVLNLAAAFVFKRSLRLTTTISSELVGVEKLRPGSFGQLSLELRESQCGNGGCF